MLSNRFKQKRNFLHQTKRPLGLHLYPEERRHEDRSLYRQQFHIDFIGYCFVFRLNVCSVDYAVLNIAGWIVTQAAEKT